MLSKLNILSMIVFMSVPSVAFAVDKVKDAPKQVLIKNVNIFDGKNKKLAMGQDVLIEANLIKKLVKV